MAESGNRSCGYWYVDMGVRMSNWKNEIAEKGIGCKTEFRSGWEDKEEYIICGKNGFCTSCHLKREDRLKTLNLAEEYYEKDYPFTNKDFMKLNEDLNLQLDDKEEEITRLNENVRELEKKYDGARKVMIDQEEEIVQLKARIHKLEGYSDNEMTLKEKLANQEESIEELMKQITQLKAELLVFKSMLKKETRKA